MKDIQKIRTIFIAQQSSPIKLPEDLKNVRSISGKKMKNKINKCPRCDTELIRKAWIEDHTAIHADTCGECGYYKNKILSAHCV